MTSTPKLARLAEAAFWCALVSAYVITHWPRLSIPAGTDQSFHSVGYLGLGVLAANRLWFQGALTVRSALGWFLALSAWAAFDEASQPWFGRHADLNDWSADLRGLGLGLGLFWLITSLHSRFSR